MLSYATGDVLKTKDRYIVHGCNSSGKMGAGVALQIAKKFPWAAYDLQKEYESWVTFNASPLKLGVVIISPSLDKGPNIIHCITQSDYGRKKNKRYVSYDALDECFQKITEFIQPVPLSMPRIGAGLGGGSWDIIVAIVNERLCKKGFSVTVWDLP